MKQMVKKCLALLPVVGMLIWLCGCGVTPAESGPTDGSGVAGTAAPTETIETAKPVQIAAELDPTACEPERGIKTFQDIASFFGRRIDEWQETYRNIELTEDDRAAVLEYINLLIHEFDYEIVDSYHFDPAADDLFGGYFLDGTWEVCLGLTTVDTGRETKGMEAKVPCDIDLYCKKGELKMWFTDLFHTEDFGYRWSDSKGDRFNEVYGQRAVDAYYLENGRYYNSSDRALSVEAGTHGEAVIIINGKEVRYSTDATVRNEMYSDYPRDDYEIEIYDFLDGVEDECIQITVPKTLVGGEVYTLSDALAWMGNSPITVFGEFEDSGWAGSYGHPTARNAMHACTLRVLQWNEVECVVYLSMDLTYELEPMTVEVLAAMPAYGSLWGESFNENEAVTLKVGDSLELEYNGPYVFMPNYETYEWSISSGQGVSIVGAGDSCTVTAVSHGQIVIKCVYSYGKDEPDVLTGIPRNENHTKTKLYYINIVP